MVSRSGGDFCSTVHAVKTRVIQLQIYKVLTETRATSAFYYALLYLLITWYTWLERINDDDDNDDDDIKTRAQQLLRLATVPEPIGSKSGEWLLCPFPWGAGFPSNTLSPGPRPISTRGILNRPYWSIQPFGHNMPTLQDRYRHHTDRQRSDSIGRTVLANVNSRYAVARPSVCCRR